MGDGRKSIGILQASKLFQPSYLLHCHVKNCPPRLMTGFERWLMTGFEIGRLMTDFENGRLPVAAIGTVTLGIGR